MPQYQKPPSGRIRRVFWNWKVKLEGSTALSMMETWEKILILSILLLTTLAFWISVFTYYPGHIAYLSRRFSYYVFEDENVDAGKMFKEWLGREIRRGWEGVKAIGSGAGAGGNTEL